MELEQLLENMNDVMNRMNAHGGQFPDDTPAYLLEELIYLTGELMEYDVDGVAAAFQAINIGSKISYDDQQ